MCNKNGAQNYSRLKYIILPNKLSPNAVVVNCSIDILYRYRLKIL